MVATTYYGGYGRTVLEHKHVVTLTHLWGGQQQFVCECGESMIGPERLVKAMLTAHRMEVFPRVREALT